MSDLTAFLSQNAIKVDNEKIVVSKRFVNKDGKPMEWEIRAIDSKEDEEIRKQCTYKAKVPGKKGQFMPEFDQNKYLGEVCATSIVYPSLKNGDLQKSYGVMGETELLKTMLTPGEYTDLVTKVNEINGFDESFEEKVEAAKN
jgi:hypothetical protein